MKSKLVYSLCLATVVFVVFAWTPMAVQATTPRVQPSPPFQFAQQDEITFTWESVKKGEAVVQVLNNTAVPYTLDVDISDMKFKDTDDVDLPTNRVVEPDPDPVTLPRGGVAQVKIIKAEDGIPPQAGTTYSGFLSAYESDMSEPNPGTAIQILLNIEVPDPEEPVLSDATGKTPTPLTDSWIVQYRRWFPRIPYVLEDPPALVTYEQLPLDIDILDCCDVAIDGRKPLGYLTGEMGGMATVFGIRVPNDHLANGKLGLELSTEGVEHPGKYTGDIDLLPDDQDKGVVGLTLDVKDHWLWPALAVVVGIVLAIGVQRGLKVNRNVLVLYEQEVKNLGEEAFKKAQAKFDALPASKPYKAYTIRADFDAQREKVKADIAELQTKYKLSTVTLDEENEDYKAIVERLAQMKDHVQTWGKFAGELVALETARDNVEVPAKLQEEFKPEDTDKDEPPAFLNDVKRLLTAEALTLDEPDEGDDKTLKARREDVDKATRLAKSWPAWVERVVDARESIDKIDAHAIGAPAIIRNWVEQARFESDMALKRLWKEDNLDGIEERGALQALARAEDIVAGLRRYEEEKRDWGLFADVPSFTISFRPPYGIDALPEEDVERLRVVQRTLWRNDWLMFGLALLTGVLTGLNELYFDKAFGSLLDYINAVAWGFGAKAVLEVIYAAINRLVRVVD